MATRLNTKIGDIFSVDLENGHKKYFQLIAFDLAQLNSDVIRAFKEEYKIGETHNLDMVVQGQIEFYAHCVTKFGLKLKLWQKVGNTGNIGQIDKILFRGTNDYGSKVGEENILISHNWYVWKINDKDYRTVGKLTGENRLAEIGVVVNPYDIVNRIKTGKYNFFYPGFE